MQLTINKGPTIEYDTINSKFSVYDESFSTLYSASSVDYVNKTIETIDLYEFVCERFCNETISGGKEPDITKDNNEKFDIYDGC